MTFELPGNARTLRFTGEARSLGRPNPEPQPLGRPRDRRPELPSHDVSPASIAPAFRGPRTERAPMQLQPLFADDPDDPLTIQREADPPTTAFQRSDPPTVIIDDRDDAPTHAMSRAAYERNARTVRALSAPRVPNLRASDPMQTAPLAVVRDVSPSPPHARGLPLSFWLTTAVALAIASFYAAPRLMTLLPLLHAH